ncbi:cell wall-binding repeat-containing protein [Kineococcus sp. SYSU DK005]|uniref:cell wall-binding repeat-containing protein n=1 Tax=Kineococcus sp. SYSU DK005 TaxID=3383126 RepID=UPI003D7CA4A4
MSAAIVGLALLASAAPASAAPGLRIDRVAGVDRYMTAVQASQDHFPGSSTTTAVLASGESPVDALAAAYVAGANGAPVLLTRPAALPAETSAELRRLGAARVVLAGDQRAISDDVARELGAEGLEVVRAGGVDRYETAAKLVALGPDAAPRVVFVASSPVDAAAASPLVAARRWPVLLTSRDAVPAATSAALARFPGAEVVVLGDERAVSAATAAALGADRRLGGTDRYATAVEVARYATANAGFTGRDVGLAAGRLGPRGDDLADALVAGPVLGRSAAPLLLAEDPERLGATTRAYLSASANGLTGRALVFGGPASVGATVLADLAAATGTTVPLDDVTAAAPVEESPAGGAVGVATSVSPRVTFDEPLSAGLSTARLVRLGPPDTVVPATVTVDGASIVLDPTAELVLGGVYRATFLARDLAGNSSAAVTVTFSTASPPPVDRSAPTLAGTAPVAGATGVDVAVSPAATFSEALDPASSTASLSSGGTTVAATVSVAGRTLTLDPAADLARSTSYTASFTAVDGAGNSAAPVTVTFTTAAPPDTAAPVVTAQATRPRVADTSVTFTADEPLDPATVTTSDFQVSSAGPGQSVDSVAVDPTGRVVTVVLAQPMALREAVTLVGAVSDLAANPSAVQPSTLPVLARPVSFTFTDGGTGGRYGDHNGDQVVVTLDAPVGATSATRGFSLDSQDGTGPMVYGAGGPGSALPDTYDQVARTVTFTIANASSITGRDTLVVPGTTTLAVVHPDVDRTVVVTR